MEFYDKVVELLRCKQNLLYKVMMLNSLVDEYRTDDNANIINEDLRDAFGTVGLSPMRRKMVKVETEMKVSVVGGMTTHHLMMASHLRKEWLYESLET